MPCASTTTPVSYTHLDPNYPALLAELVDAPPLLFVAGEPGVLEAPQLAMVGSRRASQPGLDNARAFARSLAAGGFVITSGLALGIDGAAHQGALAVSYTHLSVISSWPSEWCRRPEAEPLRAPADQTNAVRDGST